MDGMTNYRGVYVLAATNQIDIIDKALLRPGRFPDQIEVPRPDRAATSDIVDIYLRPEYLDGKTVAEYGGAKTAFANIKEEFLSTIYDKKESIVEKEGLRKHYKDIVSGDVVREIFDKAKMLHIRRMDKDATYSGGVKREDVMSSLRLCMNDFWFSGDAGQYYGYGGSGRTGPSAIT
jgi:SpoVK/Ycf46/Vps4 family AAA+-type ATPase